VRIGIVSYWFNRGQAVVARYLRSTLEQLGHKTFVLARPASNISEKPGIIDRGNVWSQPDVTEASVSRPSVEEYTSWVERCELNVAFFDQNYQFDEIATLRARGLTTIGRFVWESFGEQHVGHAKQAFSLIYSLTSSERERYSRLGIDSTYVRFGCHPELVNFHSTKRNDGVWFFYPAGYLTKRKPTGAVIEAFRTGASTDSRLIVKAQRPLEAKHLIRPETQMELARRGRLIPTSKHPSPVLQKLDSRIHFIDDDLPWDDYYRLFASCHVCVAPSRWEGLGLHLFEAISFSMPIITNDIPPMNEVVSHGHNGFLVGSHLLGYMKSGLESHEPDVRELAGAFKTLSDPNVLEAMTANSSAKRAELSWERTTNDFARLLDSAVAARG
jgi:1,2-diacylglycerol 3-alpha-glucosyltransferase